MEEKINIESRISEKARSRSKYINIVTDRGVINATQVMNALSNHSYVFEEIFNHIDDLQKQINTLKENISTLSTLNASINDSIKNLNHTINDLRDSQKPSIQLPDSIN